MSKEVKRYYVNPSGPEYLVEMSEAYQSETGFAGLVSGADYDALLAERDRPANEVLETELRALKFMHQCNAHVDLYRELKAERDQLKAEVEALRKDAERWRLYRQGFINPEALDADVDSALSAQGGE
ncbi:hypothetical protein [Pseudomonas sp.]|uniref:hypothetical protein n=1 Tax=Pseudomonas sp. TaxID=306 RepID=UPI0019F086B3|nr:hypothetical protein [Pseudomonas sp.]MBF0675546.1 hypothetical protein [Pseudomonas sp.]